MFLRTTFVLILFYEYFSAPSIARIVVLLLHLWTNFVKRDFFAG